jgi:predicted AAA+ superfamily ATPase
MPHIPLYVLSGLTEAPWWTRLRALSRSLARPEETGVSRPARVRLRYGQLVTELVLSGHGSLAHAAAHQLLFSGTLLRGGGPDLPAGLRQAAELDLEQLQAAVKRDWQREVQQLPGGPVPPLVQLAAAESPDVEEWAGLLLDRPPAELLARLLQRYARYGQGLTARHHALRWKDRELQGIARPAAADWAGLSGLDRQLELLQQEAEAFLLGLPAQDTLLYGPRGSGKSTAVRGLLHRYAARGLRMVEVPQSELPLLPELLLLLEDSPLRWVLFIDDLGFESDDTSFQPLKTLLDGTLGGRPGNTLVIATSNRRHLLKQRFSDRPDPLDDDVHAWDTQQQQLALADRFGRVITFPDNDQRRYLELVAALAATAGLEASGLDEKAIRFAQWGNGYSGRTARQFVDTLLRQAAAPEHHQARS